MTDTSSSQSTYFDAQDSDEPQAGIGLSNPHLNYEVRKKLDAMNKLHSTGVQIDIDLPQIAVIGSQSAGKSSLIESISGITLPRAPGTCTRCPMECRLSRSQRAWQCIVSLRFTTDASGQALGQARNEQFGGIIYDKTEVDERICRAQRAILNPHKSPESILSQNSIVDHQDPSQLTFSMNCVTLHISGPDIADLSFCDLPGLIASVSAGTDNSITLVENLVTSYIKKPSCIILLTVACETDFENQGAHNLAKKYDPEGKRTIGVLTKPDRIPLGEENVWLPFIRDEKEQLENNWFCVKQPSSNELKLKMTWALARQAEIDFFSTTSRGRLSRIPIRNIWGRASWLRGSAVTPQIQDELDRSISDTRELLARLPPPPTSDPRSEILTLLHKFSQDLALQIEGVPDGVRSVADQGLIQAIRPEQEKFKKAIRATTPNFLPFEKSVTNWAKHLSTPYFLYPEEGFPWDAEKLLVPQSQAIYVEEVLERAHRARTRELPGHYPFVVQKTYIQDIVKQWNAPSEALCRSVHDIMSKHTKQLVQKHFEIFGQGKLAQQVRSILQQHISKCLLRAEERVKWLRNIEDFPFSLNTHHLAHHRDGFLAFYKLERENHLKRNPANTTSSSGIFSTPSAPIIQAAASSTFEWTRESSPLAKNSTTTQAQGSPLAFASLNAKAQQLPHFDTGSGPKPAPVLKTTPSQPPSTNPFGIAAPFSFGSPPSTVSPFSAAASAMPPAPPSISNLNSSATGQPQTQAALSKVLSGLAEMGMINVKAEDLSKLLPDDRMEPALAIMADVRAYFQVAYKRFVDNVPLAVDFELVRGVETEILSVLVVNLGINGPKGDEICQGLAQEGRKVAERRRDLKKKLERLETARLELFAL